MTITRAPKTIVVYDLNGGTDYTIPFEYLARKFVVVTLIGQDRKVLTLNTDYRFISKTQISLADPSPAGYTSIELRRFTSATDRLVDFHDGSILRAYDLNLSQIQTLHVAEEARDLAGDSIAVDDNGDLDARGRRIVNLVDGIDDTDAVNFGQLKEFDTSTLNNATLAKASADNAKVSETNAKSSETRCIEAETKSVASAGTAMTAAADANRSKVAAEEAENIVTPLVPIVEQASKDAAEAAVKAEQAVQDVKDLGAVPIGMIAMFGHKAIPAGYIDLCVPNPTFDILEYPDLAKLYPTGVLKSMLGKYPKGGALVTVGATRSWNIPEHTHEVSGNTSVDTHNHTVNLISKGIREALNKNKDYVDVDHVTVTYAIKAAGKVSDEGLMEVTAIKADVARVETDYKAADVALSGRIDVLTTRRYIVDEGKHSDTNHHYWYRKWDNGFVEQGGRFDQKVYPKDVDGATLYSLPINIGYDAIFVTSSQENCTSTYHWRSGFIKNKIRGKFFNYASGAPAPASFGEWITWAASGWAE